MSSSRNHSGTIFTGIAQLVEHRSPKPSVGSSSLSSRAKLKITMFKKITNYCKESYDELVHKVSWPNRSELSSSAVVVLTASLLDCTRCFSNGFCLPVCHGRCYLSALINSDKNV